MTKGVFLSCWGKPGYGYAAYNLAFSIKYHSPDIHVTLLCDDNSIKYLNKDWLNVFDEIIPLDRNLLTSDPGEIKTSLYQLMPYDYNLFLDVDALCLKDITPLFDELINKGGYYYTSVIGSHTIDKGRDFDDMRWAWADDIWEHYNLPKDAVLPATNSSFQFIKKCDESKRLFDQISTNFSNPIPLNRLRMQWGGSQPDELYLNIALCQLKIDASSKPCVWYADKTKARLPYIEVTERFYFLSIYGANNFIMPMYKEWYDRLLMNWHREKKLNFFTKYVTIVADKHANNKPSFQRSSQLTITPSHEKINLFLSWYEAKDLKRRDEIFKTLEKNKYVDKIFLVFEGEFSDEAKKQFSERVIAVKATKRPTYSDMFAVANAHADEDTISIISNADIEYNLQACDALKAIDYTNRCLAMTRWDKHTARLAASNGLTQDAWIFKGQIKEVDADFFLGIPRCDHVIATELKKAGYELINPCLDLKLWHYHSAKERSYTLSDSIQGEGLAVKPCNISPYLKKSLLLIQSGHFGDILICLPIAKKLSEKYNVYWLCPKMYHELFANIDYCKPVDSKGQYDKILDLDFGHGGKPEAWWQENKHRFNSFVEAKYELAGIDIEQRWNLKFKRNLEKENSLYEKLSRFTKQEYALCHEQSAHVKINAETSYPKLSLVPIPGYNLFDWLGIIVNAKEIHCIDSSLANLIEVIKEAEHIPKYIYEGNNGGGVMMSIYKNNWNEAQVSA